MDRDTDANGRFSCSPRERAVFEAGIKMATIYHQFVGTPFNLDSVEAIERGFEKAIQTQPYVRSASIKISRDGLNCSGDHYCYKSLTGDMIDAVVVIDFDGVVVTAEMRYDKDLQYPLMYVSSIEGGERTPDRRPRP